MTLLDLPKPPAAPAFSAATLEIDYLRPVLESLPDSLKSALDVGAHKGDFSEALADLGFNVLAVEPQDYMADRFAARLAERIEDGIVMLARCAVSDHTGEADLIIGSASSVSTLEPDWTSVAFPEEFKKRRTMRVPIVPLADLLAQHEYGPVGFAKIDVEGHEAPALGGLFREGTAPPSIVMFEANQRFAGQAAECLRILRAQGYVTFDIFIRIGADPVAAERFAGEELPAVWHRCNERYFYANIIAYHESLPEENFRSDPIRFVQEYQMNAARDLLRASLRHEAQNPVPVHPVWNTARHRLREYLLESDWRDFLRNPVCKEMFVRGRWGPGQDYEYAGLEGDAFGRKLLKQLRDPDVGSPRCSEQVPGVSTNLLGMMWYLMRVHQQNRGSLPKRIIEVGGGYGALAFAYATCSRDASWERRSPDRPIPRATTSPERPIGRLAVPETEYVIVDLPEMLAIQHYFLTLALPDQPVVFADSPGKTQPKPGEITLVPISRLSEAQLTGDQLISTFALSEMPRELQRRIEQADYFGAKQIFITGQLSTEFPDLDLVSHGEVVGAAMHRFPCLTVERFHVGDNYLLTGERETGHAKEQK